MQKGFAQPIVILVIVLVAVLGIIYFYLPKNNQSINIKVTSPIQQIKSYTNQNLGFEISYVKDLTAKEDTEEEFNKRGNGDFRKNFKGYVQYEPGKFLGGVVVLDKTNSYDTNPFTLWVFDNSKDLTIDVWYKNYWYYPFVWGDFTYTGKSVLAPHDEATVSGQMAKSGIIDYQPGKPKFVYLSKDKKMYLFRIIGDSGGQLLSNFRFLQTTVSTSSSLKSCTNSSDCSSNEVCSDFRLCGLPGANGIMHCTLGSTNQFCLKKCVNDNDCSVDSMCNASRCIPKTRD